MRTLAGDLPIIRSFFALKKFGLLDIGQRGQHRLHQLCLLLQSLVRSTFYFCFTAPCFYGEGVLSLKCCWPLAILVVFL